MNCSLILVYLYKISPKQVFIYLSANFHTMNKTIPLLFTLSLMLAAQFCGAQTAYITNYGDNTVSVINVATNTVIDTIAVGRNPYAVSVSADGSKVYVTNLRDSTVSVINTATNTVTDTIKVGSHPIAFGDFISTHKAVGIPTYSIDAASISIYPNPAGNQLTIHTSFNAWQKATVSIMNVLGQEVTQSAITNPQSAINISSLPIGVYFLQLKWEGGSVMKKFVKE